MSAHSYQQSPRRDCAYRISSSPNPHFQGWRKRHTAMAGTIGIAVENRRRTELQLLDRTGAWPATITFSQLGKCLGISEIGRLWRFLDHSNALPHQDLDPFADPSLARFIGLAGGR